MVICLGLASPPGSSNLPESRRAALCLLFGLASNGVYICPVCYQPGGSLLHCPSTLTGDTGGIFLLHCPWSRLRQTLSGILPCEARTFLSRSFSAFAAATICLTQIQVLFYHRFPFLSIFLPISFTIFFRHTCLYLKAASTDKLPNNGILRNVLTADSQYVIQKLKQPFGLQILWTVFWNLEQNRLCILL